MTTHVVGRTAERPNAAADIFARHVQEALEHLYDPVYLERHALAGEEWVSGRASPERGKALRARVLAAVERLRPTAPEGATGPADRAWRRYRLLRLRYLDSLDAAAVRRKLASGRPSTTRS